MRLSFRSGGESHGRGVIAMIEGLPKGLRFDQDFVDAQLRRRQRGYGRGGRQRIESDHVEVLGGVYRDEVIEAPLCLLIPNRDDSIERMPTLTRPRPGHVDLAGCLRHGDRDIRSNLERASARETAARVAAGAVAQLLLREIGAEVLGHVVRIGDVAKTGEPGEGLEDLDALGGARAAVEQSDFGVFDASLEDPLKAAIDAAIQAKDSLGGVVEVVAIGLPPGLGSHAQWNQRLDGRLAQALMSIQAIKAVEIGIGTRAGELPGSQVHDAILPADPAGAELGHRRGSNRAGGLEAGITNGQPLVVRATKKPIATLRQRLPSLDLDSGEAAESAFERSDVCAVPAASVIAEGMVALTLADAALELFGGASLGAFKSAHEAHMARAARVVGGAESP